MVYKKKISLLLKIGISIFCLYYLYKQLHNQQNTDDFNIVLVIKNNWEWMSLIVVMMFINWFVEAIKWRILIAKIEKISIRTSLRAIFSGITVSVFTPNRIGEYGGRVFCLEKADRVQGVLITILGSMSQLLTTIFFGILGFCVLPMTLKLEELDNFCINIDMNEVTDFLTIIIGYSDSIILCLFMLAFSILLIVFFIHSSRLTIFLNRISWLSKLRRYNKVFSFYNRRDLINVLSLSVTRYFIFTTQFFILLQIFKVDITYFESIVLISVMLLIISSIPALTITEIAQRGVVASFLFGQLSNNCNGIFSATFSLWIINLLIPAVLGTFFVFTLKFFRK